MTGRSSFEIAFLRSSTETSFHVPASDLNSFDTASSSATAYPTTATRKNNKGEVDFIENTSGWIHPDPASVEVLATGTWPTLMMGLVQPAYAYVKPTLNAVITNQETCRRSHERMPRVSS